MVASFLNTLLAEASDLDALDWQRCGREGSALCCSTVFLVQHYISKTVELYPPPPPPPQIFSTCSQATLQSADLSESPFTVYPSPSTKLRGMGGAGRLGRREGLGVAKAGGSSKGAVGKVG